MQRRLLPHLVFFGVFAAALCAAADPAPEELDQNRVKVQAIRKNSEQYARLHENVKAFLELPEHRREAIVKLDQQLHAMPPQKQQRNVKVLERYADWLDQLKKNAPSAYKAIKTAPDAETRLALIASRRDYEWMALQPKAHRDRWAKLHGEARAKYIAELRAGERRKSQSWLIAARFWKELDSKQLLPARLVDFSEKLKGKDLGKFKDIPKGKEVTEINPVKDHVEYYLMPHLTAAEKQQLADAEGRWPDYPMALVAVASKYPTAFPPRNVPTRFKDLPEPVQRKFDKKTGATKAAAKLVAEIQRHEGPGFASKFAEIALREKLYPFGRGTDGNEYMACTFLTLTKEMRAFVEKQLGPAMKNNSADERRLVESSGKWPEYPRAIQELSAKYNLCPPWHVLPDADKWHWDRYRLEKCRVPAAAKAADKGDAR